MIEAKTRFLNLAIINKKIINEICEISQPFYPKKLVACSNKKLNEILFISNLCAKYHKNTSFSLYSFYGVLNNFYEDEIEFKKGIPKNTIIVNRDLTGPDIVKINNKLKELFRLLKKSTDLMILETNNFKDDEFCNFDDRCSLLNLYNIC